YLRHFMICRHGHIRERDVYERVRALTGSTASSVRMMDDLSASANDYVAIQMPDHPRWNVYDDSIRGSIRTVHQMRVVVLRPLMLAVATMFSTEEAVKAFRKFVSWSARFLIVGGGRSGSVEESYAALAKDVTDRKITTTAQLAAKASFVPNDAEFAAAFDAAT